MTFDEIMNYCADNNNVYDMLLNSLKKQIVVPFIGAGMSDPIYPTWPKLLEELSGHINNIKIKDQIRFQIPNSPQIAADQIAKARSLSVVLDDLRMLLKKKKITEYSEIEKMAIWILPELFPQTPVITTNYEGLLKYVFEKKGEEFGITLTPSRHDRSAQAKQRNLHYLYKIHGDIDDETEEDVIFTASQYQEKYNPSKELVQDLTEWFSGRVMLFLGCSLEKDNTIDILKCGYPF